MLKIKDIKNFLQGYSEESIIIFDRKNPTAITSLSNGDMYISSTNKIGNCKTCGYAIYGIQDYNGGEYVGYCPECDCNKTEFEFLKISNVKSN